ncbi:hypothetical protein BD626DRAFT_472695 [Schizophyllum amplum]|uniref:Uncharacterized protein n=1 Tax=Schizophyllum amplum TaxID=97359 RepID=A0A550CW60_9AGAR|nr:hypothetical protein BD626DRAFT_472695 [Auriculariopsis ampla]
MASWFSFLRGPKFDEHRARPTTEQVRAVREPKPATGKGAPPRRPSQSEATVPKADERLREKARIVVLEAAHLPQPHATPGPYITVQSANPEHPGVETILRTDVAADGKAWYEGCDVCKDNVVSFTVWHTASDGDPLGESETYTVQELLQRSLGETIDIPIQTKGKGKNRQTYLYIIVDG